jgi:hypothetical protein
MSKFNGVFIFGTVLAPFATIPLLQGCKKAPRETPGSLEFTG